MNVIFKNTPIYNTFYGEHKKAVVLLHGFLESSKVWGDYIPILKKRYRLIVPDLFGHGNTPKHGKVHSMEEMADAVNHILDVANIKSAAFIGHSMGGYVSLAFLERYPDRIDRLLLLNSSPFADSAERLRERDQVIKIVQQHKSVMIKTGVRRLFSESNRLLYLNKIEELIQEALKMEVESIIASTRGMKKRKDRTAILKKYKGRKWIFAGEEDALIPCDALEKVARETGTQFFKFRGGHMSYIENRDLVLAGIKEFLK